MTIFDFSVNLDTMEWEPWRVPDWEYPKVPAEVDFPSLLVPTVDSTRALAVVHQMQVGWKITKWVTAGSVGFVPGRGVDLLASGKKISVIASFCAVDCV